MGGGVCVYLQYTVIVSSILRDANMGFFSFLGFDAHIRTKSMQHHIILRSVK